MADLAYVIDKDWLRAEIQRMVEEVGVQMTDGQLKDIFSYHAPTPEQREVYEKINAAFLECAKVVNAVTPDGPGKTVAIRKLSDARMAANASVALEGRF